MKMKIRLAHIITVACLIAAAVLLYPLFSEIATGPGTVFEFKAGDTGNNGFSREAIVYTEDGTTYVTFTGKITTDGTAKISMIDEDGKAVYRDTYTAVKSEKLDIKITNLTPNAYYILRFSSDNANAGHLLLTTDQALVERPERPQRPERTIPEHS